MQRDQSIHADAWQSNCAAYPKSQRMQHASIQFTCLTAKLRPSLTQLQRMQHENLNI